MGQLEDAFREDPKGFARAHSFDPGDYSSLGGFSWYGTARTPLDGDFTGFTHTEINAGQRIARITMKEGLTVHGKVVVVKPSIRSEDGLNCYFLPWDSRGGAVELTIREAEEAGSDEARYPRFFFTVVLSGCSIMFKGDARCPTIFHCGTGGDSTGANTAGDPDVFWLDLVRQAESRRLGRVSATMDQDAPRQVLSTDYMDWGDGRGNAPIVTANLEKDLLAHYGNRMVLERVESWGAVFGFRDGKEWRFYLQQNATITFQPIEQVILDIRSIVRKSFGPIKYNVKRTVSENRHQIGESKSFAKPITLTKVFPGAGVVKLTDSWKSLI